MSVAALLGFDFGAEKLAGYAVKGLAVGGGFLVGYVLGGLIAYALDRWVFAKKTPTLVKRGIRVVAGLALAILVALIVFGKGGEGLFGGGGGEGKGKGTPTPDPAAKTSTPTPAPTPQPEPTRAKTSDGPAAEDEIRVVVLGGTAVKGGRQYEFDSGEARTLPDAVKELTDRRDKNPRVTKMRMVYDPNRSPVIEPFYHSAYTQLAQEAEKVKLQPLYPPLPLKK